MQSLRFFWGGFFGFVYFFGAFWNAFLLWNCVDVLSRRKCLLCLNLNWKVLQKHTHFKNSIVYLLLHVIGFCQCLKFLRELSQMLDTDDSTTINFNFTFSLLVLPSQSVQPQQAHKKFKPLFFMFIMMASASVSFLLMSCQPAVWLCCTTRPKNHLSVKLSAMS